MRSSAWLLVSVLLAVSQPVLAQQGANCRDVGGAISTNFVTRSDVVPSSTLGTATGDLRGGLGVTVQSISQAGGALVFHNRHQWVTESGDTLLLKDADATAFGTPVGGLFAVAYVDGVEVNGGTGRFNGATGTLRRFGAANLVTSEIVLRYEGTICTPPVAR